MESPCTDDMNILVLTPGCSGYPIIQSYQRVAEKVFLLGFRKYEKKFTFQMEKAKEQEGKNWKDNIELIYVDSWLEYYKKAKQIIRTEKVQVVLTQEPYGNLIAWKILMGYDIRLIQMMCQDYLKYIQVSDRTFFTKYPLIFLNWLCLQISCRRAEIICLSNSLKEKASEYDSKKITLLPIFGINLNIFKKNRIEKRFKEVFEIITVARLSSEKGHKYLFEALKKINEDNPNWILHVIGDGPLKEELEELRDELGLKGKIFFYGYLEHKEIAEFYNSSDLFILPSLEEGLGYVSGEALACGCPVIASRVGGIPDIIINKKVGLLFEPRDSDDIKDKINYIINNKDMTMQMAEDGRQHIIKNYNSEKVMKKFEEILKFLPD